MADNEKEKTDAIFDAISSLLVTKPEELFDLEQLLYQLPQPATEEETLVVVRGATAMLTQAILNEYLSEWYETVFLPVKHAENFSDSANAQRMIEKETFLSAMMLADKIVRHVGNPTAQFLKSAMDAAFKKQYPEAYRLKKRLEDDEYK